MDMNKFMLLSSVAAYIAILPVNVGAQNSSGTGEKLDEVETIIVTARRREEELSKVPISITAFTGDMLEEKNVTALTDLVKITPGINITTGGVRTSPFITIR